MLQGYVKLIVSWINFTHHPWTYILITVLSLSFNLYHKIPQTLIFVTKKCKFSVLILHGIYDVYKTPQTLIFVIKKCKLPLITCFSVLILHSIYDVYKNIIYKKFSLVHLINMFWLKKKTYIYSLLSLRWNTHFFSWQILSIFFNSLSITFNNRKVQDFE